MPQVCAKDHLRQEAIALLSRLDSVKPFSIHMPMVMAAAISPGAMTAIEKHVQSHSRKLRELIGAYLSWLEGPGGVSESAANAQRKFATLRLCFTSMLSQFEIFAEAVTQRSEHDYGVWLSGLDVLAEDALRIPDQPYAVPPLVCYLDRGIGAAIRRIRTRLPGGTSNPVTIIRVPRERMIGSGVAASIVHETGHQAAAFLNLVHSLRREFIARSAEISQDPKVIAALVRWMPEIISDFWSVGKLGISATMGVMTVVSLPRFYVLRFEENGTHPTPWVRVKLSAGMGNALYPDPQWQRLSEIWGDLYPLSGLAVNKQGQLLRLEAAIPAAATIIVEHRAPALGNRALHEIMPCTEQRPQNLRERFSVWTKDRKSVAAEPPTTAMAVMGQAKFDDRLAANVEARMVNDCLRRWALRRALDTGATCAVSMQSRRAW